MQKGSLKADAIALSSVSINFMTDSAVHIEAEAKFISTEDGRTYGTSKSTQFGKEVREKIAELQEAIELSMVESLCHTDVGLSASPAEQSVSHPTGIGERFSKAGEGTKPL